LQEHSVKLEANLSVPSASITATNPTGGIRRISIPDAADEGAQF
jgi:hypothetical protein